MPRSVLALSILISSLAFAEVDLEGYDAFLADKTRRELDVKALSPEVRELVESGRISTMEKRHGVPTFFWAARDGRGLRGLKLSPEQAARRYLFAYAELYGARPSALAESRLHRLHDLGTGAIIAAFHRDVNGVRVFNDELKVVMNQNLELIALTGYLTPARKVLGEYSLSSESVIDLAVQQMTGFPLAGPLRRLPTDEAGFERFELQGQPSPVRVRRVYYPLPNGVEPAWHLELELSDEGTTGSDSYAFVFSARDGRMLYRKNLTVSDFSYRVWADATGSKIPFDGPQGNDATPHPQGTNNQYNPPYVMPNLVTLSNAGLATNDPWLPANATQTDGNNVVAYADFNSPNGFTNGDLKATTTAPGVFDRTYDTGLNPGSSADQRMAAVTQLFYNINFFHDWFYDVGFDEKSGNAQANNFGRGGAGNDALYAEAQDYSGTNNANMSTPSDGQHPRMQMYVFNSGVPASVAIQGGSTYSSGVADFGPQSFTLTGALQLVNDNDASNMGSTLDACQATGWTSNVMGKIAVIDRGTCTFAEKVLNAQNNGAIGAIILNTSFGGAIPLSGTGPMVTIPSLSISRNSGNTLRMRLQAGTPTTATMTRSMTIDRDGTIDNAIVAHEWGHYISNRLIGDGNGIANLQGVGMGEGWGDFHSLLMSVKESDTMLPGGANFEGTYGMAGYTSYASDRNGYYWGIRRYPYSTNMMKNPLTFKHIQQGVALPAGIPVAFGSSGNGNAQVHATGEVWATMLWECYAALLRDNARLTFQQAQDRMRAYLVAGYKTTPLLPTFVDARDAILAAAVANDPTDFALFSAAFAKRGLGMLAVPPEKEAAGNRPLTESFITGNAFQIVKVTLDDAISGCDRDAHLDLGETGRLTVTIKNVGVGLLSSTTGTVRTSAMGVNVAGGGALTFPSVPPFGTATASVEVSLVSSPGNAGATFEIDVTDPTTATPGPVKVTENFRLNFDAKPTGSFNDDVEAPMTAWTFSNNPNGDTGSDFRVYEDSATSHWFFGPNPKSPADTYLISPVLDVGQNPFVFTFSHRYQFEGDAAEPFDGAVIEARIEGTSQWVDLGSKLSQPYTGMLPSQTTNPLRNRMVYTGESPNYPAWSTVTADLGTMFAGRSVRIRFRIGSDDALGLKGWEIDNLTFSGITNRPFPSVVTDPNLCTNRAPTVVPPTTLFVNEGQVVKLNVVASDPDGEMLTVAFTQVAGPQVTLQDQSFTAPQVENDTTIDFEIVASDGRATSVPVIQRVVVRDLNQTPVATVTPAEQTVDEGTMVTITGSATDADSEPITGMRWVQRTGPAVGLAGERTGTLTFTAPEVMVDTVLTFELYASDPLSEGAPATATVIVKNVPTQVQPPPVTPQGCGCAVGNDGSTAWLAAAMAIFFVLARRRQR